VSTLARLLYFAFISSNLLVVALSRLLSEEELLTEVELRMREKPCAQAMQSTTITNSIELADDMAILRIDLVESWYCTRRFAVVCQRSTKRKS
jgi:hypothetical protein